MRENNCEHLSEFIITRVIVVQTLQKFFSPYFYELLTLLCLCQQQPCLLFFMRQTHISKKLNRFFSPQGSVLINGLSVSHKMAKHSELCPKCRSRIRSKVDEKATGPLMLEVELDIDFFLGFLIFLCSK